MYSSTLRVRFCREEATASSASGSRASALVLDTAGRLIIAGASGSAATLWRYTAAGALDSSFGVLGQRQTVDSAHSPVFTDLTVDSGAIYVSGYTVDNAFALQPFVAFYDPSGAPLNTIANSQVGFPRHFSMIPGGTGVETASALALKGTQLTVVGSGLNAGVSSVLAYRVSIHGAYSTTFGSASSGATDIALALDGALHVTGDKTINCETAPAVLKLN